MQIVIAGGHGQIAMLLHPMLKARGHQVRGLIRNPDHADEVRLAGAEPVLCDLEAEDDIAEPVRPADAIVFAAGVTTLVALDAGDGSVAWRLRAGDGGERQHSAVFQNRFQEEEDQRKQRDR